MNSRPDPDALLQTLDQPELNGRGRLKIFFGAAPGVGKTYAMLEAAGRELRAGTDLIIGYIEPHQRPETIALAAGLPIIAPRIVEHRGVKLNELDLLAALERRPQIILIDELAHTNAPGSPNEKRWQDIEHLLAAGIDVFTTLNVQHLETINDVISKATGVTVSETVPDAVFERAWEVELVDLTPDELIDRLQSGKVYLPEQAERAQQGFFKKGNLIALRDLALRQTADRLDRELDSYRKSQPAGGSWAVREKLLVCVGPSPLSAKLIRATRRMAASLRCRWTAVHIDVIGRPGISSGVRERVLKNLQLAERLGGEIEILSATDMVTELIKYAQEHNISKIIVGKPQQPRWKEMILGSFVYTLTRKCQEIDVYVISGDPAKPVRRAAQIQPPHPTDKIGYLGAVVIVAICTGVNWVLWHHFDPLNLVMVYLLGVVAVASRYSRGPSTLAALLSVALFDFIFVSPFWTFNVTDTEYFFTFGVMLLTGLLVSNLTLRLRAQSEILQARGQRTSQLFQFSRALSETRSRGEMVKAAQAAIGEAAVAKINILLADDAGHLPSEMGGQTKPDPAGPAFEMSPQLHAVATWALEHEQPAGFGTSVLSGSAATFFPLAINSRKMGVVGLQRNKEAPLQEPEHVQMIEAMVEILGNAVDRFDLTVQAERARLEAETERVRNILLSTVSHDLRTPLAVIEGASTTLLESENTIEPQTRRSLLETVVQEVEFLNRLVGNLLDATRLDGGTIVLRKEWQSIEEIVGAVTHRLQRVLNGREVKVRLDEDLPLIQADGVLFHQVITNLLENAVKFSPAGTSIEIRGRVSPPMLASDHLSSPRLELIVSDNGYGIAETDLPHLFDKFYRGKTTTTRSGAGLGLAVCKGIVELHGGEIRAENREGGGARFIIELPIEQQPAAPVEGPEDE